MILLVDVDGVVADLLPEWLRLYNHQYSDILKPEDITAWDMTQFVKPECGTKIYDFVNWLGLYDHIQPIRGALDGVNYLRSKDHEIYFVTANCNPEKNKWLLEHSFIKHQEEVIVCHRKNLIRGHVIIDDKPETIETFPGLSILFDAQYNRSFDWPHRARDWGEVIKFIDLWG